MLRMRILLSPVLLGLFLVVDAQSSIPVPTSTTTDSTKTLVHENDPFSDEVSKEPFELTGSLETGMHLSDKLSILGTEAIMVSQLVEKSTIEPRINSEPEVQSKSKAEPIAKKELEAKSKINPKSEASKSDSDQKLESKPEPEPAIKFDNIQSEDYGDIIELKNQPDEVDNEVIEQLVDRFLNTGSIVNKNSSKFANPSVQTLVDSSIYWKTDGLKEFSSIKDEAEIKKWINGYQVEAQKILREVAAAGWKYFSNASPLSKQGLNEAEEVLSRFVRSTSKQAKQFDSESIMDNNLKRQLSYISFEGMAALSPESFAAFNRAQNKLNRDAADTVICDKDVPPPCALKKIDLTSIFRNEKDATRLSHIWISYLTNVAKGKTSYQELIDLTNQGAKINDFSDGGAMWRSAFDLSSKNSKPMFDLKQQLENIYEKIQPLYKQLHAYMRRQISGLYGNPVGLSKDGPIPAHLFGSIDGGDWSAHFEQTKPFDEESMVAEDMLYSFHTQNYTTKQMFIKAYRYLKSVGFPPLPKTFWTNSLFSRVWSRDMICSPPAALDMRNGSDYRIKACAQLGEPDFELAHSLMVQVYYLYLYRQQPLLFREPASPSISEAIANVFAHLSTNPHYLYSQKLVPSSHLDIKDSLIINRLYKEALEHLVKIPFDLAADNWRYELFEGKIPAGKINDRWWELRKKYEGVRSPQPYNSSNLDALMHTAIAQVHSPACRSFISYVSQFQILKALCPSESVLSEGCILSEDTTQKLREMMRKGSSITWLQALEMLTGKAEFDVTALLEYYEPLASWLRNTNEVDQVIIGWDGEGTQFTPDEIPKPRSGMDNGSGILSEDRVAFPGGICASGQECLLDSHCNGTICVCNDGLYTLEIGNTFSCVPGNPADSGFGDGKGGLVIGLYASETTSRPQSEHTPSTTTQRTMRKHSVFYLSLLHIFLAIFLYL